MKVVIFVFFILFFIKGCGGSSGVISERLRIINDADDFFRYMWNINPNSLYDQSGQVANGADINISKAWEKTYGEGVTVAVIDDCFDIYHPDLYNNVIDTYNANTGGKSVGSSQCHGTEVAGVIGSLDDNHGVIGISPKVKLILINFDFQNTNDSELVAAFNYARNHRAKVINCRWGSKAESQALKNKFLELKNNNIIVVFASGNGDPNNNGTDLISKIYYN